MRTSLALCTVVAFLATGLSDVAGQTPSATPELDPTGNTGALKAQIQTGGSYDAHSGNATRVITDLSVPGALGAYGLNFTRYWNSLQMNYDEGSSTFPVSDAFGWSIFSHSWQWTASYEEIDPSPVPGTDHDDNKYTTAINITFPDGHTTQFKIVRLGHTEWLAEGGVPLWGPPYSAGDLASFAYGGRGVHDHLCNMNATTGTDFYLCLADGGSVHFVNFQATEVFDPHGLRTELRYKTDGTLEYVIDAGGRFLKLTYGTYGGGSVITKVEGGQGPDLSVTNQSVTYEYANMGQSNTSALILQHVVYQDEPFLGGAPGQKVAATYSYGTCWDHIDQYPGECVFPNGAAQPILQHADDPHFAGPMTIIEYSYRGVRCPKMIGNNPLDHPNYFRAQPFAIAAEKSLTGAAVSTFDIECEYGTRRESNGLGGMRGFYFGSSGGLANFGAGLIPRGYQLGRVTNFVPPPRRSTRPPTNKTLRTGILTKSGMDAGS